MPITSCGLRLDDAAVRVGVGLRLGLSLCVPHQCQCGSLVSSTGVHSFVCKKAPGRIARPHALNDLIARTLVSAGIPTKEPNCMSRSDGKRPDSLTLVPRKEGKRITWDSTVVCTVVDSYVSGSAREAGLAGKTAAQRKEAKYRGQATLQGTHLFQPVVVESMGTVEEATSSFLAELGHRITALSGDSREISFLFQRVSVLVQRFNSFLLRESFTADSRPDDDQ